MATFSDFYFSLTQNLIFFSLFTLFFLLRLTESSFHFDFRILCIFRNSNCSEIRRSFRPTRYASVLCDFQFGFKPALGSLARYVLILLIKILTGASSEFCTFFFFRLIRLNRFAGREKSIFQDIQRLHRALLRLYFGRAPTLFLRMVRERASKHQRTARAECSYSSHRREEKLNSESARRATGRELRTFLGWLEVRQMCFPSEYEFNFSSDLLNFSPSLDARPHLKKPYKLHRREWVCCV